MAEMQPVEPETNKPSAYIADRHRNPHEDVVKVKSSGNYLVAGIFAILATLVFLAIAVVGWMDYSRLNVA